MTYTQPLEVQIHFTSSLIDSMYERGIHRLVAVWGSDYLSTDSRAYPTGATGTLTVDNRDGRYSFGGPGLTDAQRLSPHACLIFFHGDTPNVVNEEVIWSGFAQIDPNGTTRGENGRATFRLFDSIVRTGQQDYEASNLTSGSLAWGTAFTNWAAAMDYGTHDRDTNRANYPTWTLGPFVYEGNAITFVQQLSELLDGYVWFNNLGNFGAAPFTWLAAKAPTLADVTSVNVAAGDAVWDEVIESPQIGGIETRITPKRQIISSNAQSWNIATRPTLSTTGLASGIAWQYSILFFIPDGAQSAAAGNATAVLGATSVNGQPVTNFATFSAALSGQTVTQETDYPFGGKAIRHSVRGTGARPTLGPETTIYSGTYSFASAPGQEGSVGESFTNATATVLYGILESPRPPWYNLDDLQLVTRIATELARISSPERRLIYTMPLWQATETRSKDVAERMGVGKAVHLVNIPAKGLSSVKCATLAQRLDYTPRRGPPTMTFADVVLG